MSDPKRPGEPGEFDAGGTLAGHGPAKPQSGSGEPGSGPTSAAASPDASQPKLWPMPQPPRPASGPAVPAPMAAASSGPAAPAPSAPLPPPPPGYHPPPPGYRPPTIEEIPGGTFVSFLKISARRAFRLRIDASEVLPAERASLLAASPPITDPNLQAFLAWRRSVLFLVAVALVPLTLIGLFSALRGDNVATPIRWVRLAPALAEGVFCLLCWHQLKHWAHWRRQRHKLFYGWLIFLLTPFVVFIYPLRTVFEDLAGSSREQLMALGVNGVYKRAVMPFVFAMIAMLQLAPKVISLMPGLIRASLVIKMLFPGSSAPGWLIVLAAPLYAMIAYALLIIPYQFTGSVWFVGGILAIVVAQGVLAHAGFGLAKPQSEEDALTHIAKVRTIYMGFMLLSGLLIVVALGALVDQLDLGVTDVVLAVLKFETNVLILTMIGADLVVTNLDRARGLTAGRSRFEEEAELKLATFVGHDAPDELPVWPPPPPPPSGPS